MKCFKLVYRGFSRSSNLFLPHAKKAARFIKLEILDIEKTELCEYHNSELLHRKFQSNKQLVMCVARNI